MNCRVGSLIKTEFEESCDQPVIYRNVVSGVLDDCDCLDICVSIC